MELRDITTVIVPLLQEAYNRLVRRELNCAKESRWFDARSAPSTQSRNSLRFIRAVPQFREPLGQQGR